MRVIGSEAKLLPHEARTGNHRRELTERPLAWEVLHPAVGRDHEPLGRDDGERAFRKLEAMVAGALIVREDLGL